MGSLLLHVGAANVSRGGPVAPCPHPLKEHRRRESRPARPDMPRPDHGDAADPSPSVSTMPIDSYRYVDFATRQIMKAWAARQEPGEIPFTRLGKPLRECTVALLSTAGIARNDDRPFDQE